MGYKTKADKAYDAAIAAWRERIRAEGKREVSRDEWDHLYNAVQLLTLAVRQFRHFDKSHNNLRGKLVALYEEAQAELAQTVHYGHFQWEQKQAKSPEKLPDLELVVTESEADDGKAP